MVVRVGFIVSFTPPPRLSSYRGNITQAWYKRYHFSTSHQPPHSDNSSSGGGIRRIRVVFWRRLVTTVKYVRIPFLVLSVFGLGYNQGILDYARDPESKERYLLATALAGVAATSQNIIQDRCDERYKQVQRVGNRMTRTAKAYIDTELAKSIPSGQLQGNSGTSNHGNYDSSSTTSDAVHMERYQPPQQQLQDLEFWNAAKRHMAGGPWKFLLVESSIPNAFVSEMIPRHIFVTTSMMERFITNDDEMALIMGHELSHLILGHVSRANQLEAFLRAFEVLLLTIDPTDGAMASLVFLFVVASCRSLLGAGFSQNNEREADELGIKLAAMGCYDTLLASKVFHRIHQLDTESAAGKIKEAYPFLHWFDSHPCTYLRYHIHF